MTGSMDLLPQPFAWVDIPTGPAVQRTKQRVDGGFQVMDLNTEQVTAFQISKYPITIAQFRLFIAAGGYDARQYWTDAGWQQRQDENLTEPAKWHDDAFNRDDQPVAGVSWHEAVAFCRWLTAQTGESIQMPTAWQWLRAAQGDAGYVFPWGNEWSEGRCHHAEVAGGSTGFVQQYEGTGDSPFGVIDMCGNVLEWKLSGFDRQNGQVLGDDIDSGEITVRVWGGGSWQEGSFGGQDIDVFRCDFVSGTEPHKRYTCGFRIARPLP